jgi:hypothetical protein
MAFMLIDHKQFLEVNDNINLCTVILLCEKYSSIQIDEVTDCSCIGHLRAYIQCVEDTKINEDMLSCKPIKRRGKAKEHSKSLMIS